MVEPLSVARFPTYQRAAIDGKYRRGYRFLHGQSVMNDETPRKRPSELRLAVERRLREALEETGGNLTRTARILRVDRSTMRRQIARLGLGPLVQQLRAEEGSPTTGRPPELPRGSGDLLNPHEDSTKDSNNIPE
jgi:hypothetical protein